MVCRSRRLQWLSVTHWGNPNQRQGIALLHQRPAAPKVDTIINGKDGNLYFVTITTQIGRSSTTGKVTVWTLPSQYTFATLGMTVGPDGNIWFADNSGDYIGALYLK